MPNKMKINSYFQSRTTLGAQRTSKSDLQSKEVTEKCDLAISKWMLATSIPFNTVNSPYYQQANDAIASMGAGYKGLGFHDLRGYLLTKNVEKVRKYVDSYRSIWKEMGCTIMTDGWTDQYKRTLINFLVYCPKGIVFVKSVNPLYASKTEEMLYKLFREVVLFVGQENVAHFVIDNAANYVAAGRLLEQKFKTIFWSPCAAHCINLILSDIACNLIVLHHGTLEIRQRCLISSLLSSESELCFLGALSISPFTVLDVLFLVLIIVCRAAALLLLLCDCCFFFSRSLIPLLHCCSSSGFNSR
ncbi:hypothetical protein CRG98_020726 [Punica granatum]|uniref:DUF659 domain-containing protein n=1 Tax=Punica granatum TaxID=22663 RepID=A0A2I0JRE7_PUNGR|nr:hypothetical protein CRG98_020726 [Punica granatum]